MAQRFERRQLRSQELAVNPRGGRKDRRVVRLHQETELIRRHPFAGDQRSRAARPGVQKPGAERIGPVERAGMQQAVTLGQPIPTLPHHPPGPDRAMGMGDGAGRA